MGREVIQGIVGGLVAIVAVVTLGSFGGQLYSKLAHHGGGHGKSGEHSSGDHGDSESSHGDDDSGEKEGTESSKSGGDH